MKGDLFVLRPGSGALVFFLVLLSPILRAEDAPAEKSPKTNAKSDFVKDGITDAKESAEIQEQAENRGMIKDERRLKLLLAKYDANRDGQLDEGEKKRLSADLAIWAKKYKQALARYDANKNGALDQDEKKKMEMDESVAERNERRLWTDQREIQQKVQQRLKQPPPRDLDRLFPGR